MPAPPSSHEGCQSEASPRRTRPLGEHVPVRGLERIERREPAACEEADRPPHPAADPLLEHASSSEEVSSAQRLVTKQLEQLGSWTVEHGHAERAAVVERQVDAAELEIARHVLQEVDELQPGADVVARGDQLGVVVQAEQAEHETADGVGRVAAVLLQVAPGLVLGEALVHPVRLDQPEERLSWQRELVDGRRERPQDRPRGLYRVARVELALELSERGEAIALHLVADDVHEAGEAVDGAQVGPEAPRKENRRNREVLRPRSAGYDGHIHSYTIPCPTQAGQLVTFAPGPSQMLQSTGAGLPGPCCGRFVKPIQEGS